MKEIEIVGEIKQSWFKEIKGYNSGLAISLCLVLQDISNEGFQFKEQVCWVRHDCSVSVMCPTEARTLLFLFLSSGPERLLILPIKQTIQH